MPFISRAKKTVKRGVKAVTKAAGKRYGMSYGRKGLTMSKTSVSKLAKDVMMIKSRLNVEKKFKLGNVQLGFTAQMAINAAGYNAHDLTPTWTQGLGESDRVGNSIKLTGYNMKIQLRGQIQTLSARRLKLIIIKTTDKVSTTSQIIDSMYDANPLTGLVDYHSQRDYSDNKKVHKIVRVIPMYLKECNLAFNDDRTPAIKDYNVSLKLQDTLRFETNASTTPNDYRMFFVIFCDTGNRSAATASTNGGCMVQAVNTGVEYQFHDRTWYVDN